MADSTVDIDRVVREVLSQLQRGPEKAAPAAAAKAEPEPHRDGELVVHSRVVTLSKVEDRLKSIRRLVVLPGAVVTPAVRDALQTRNIALEFAAPARVGVAEGLRFVIITTGTGFDPAAAVAGLRSEGLAVEAETSDCVIESIAKLAREVNQSNTLGAVLTAHTAAALCLANRHRGVRAVTANDTDEAAKTAAAVGANLLVLDPSRTGVFQLKRILTEFARGGVRPCPKVFATQLG